MSWLVEDMCDLCVCWRQLKLILYYLIYILNIYNNSKSVHTPCLWCLECWHFW